MVFPYRRVGAAAAVLLTAVTVTAAPPAQAAPLRDIPAPAGSRVAVATGAPGGLIFGNVTVTGARASGHLTAWPCNETRPATWAASYSPGTARATGVAVRADSAGNICFYTTAATHIIFDRTATSPAGTGNLITAKRVTDTRTTASPVTAGTVRTVPTGAPGGSVVLATLTATGASGSGWLTAYTCGQPRPVTSHVNFTAAGAVSNTAAVKTDPSGNVCVYSSATTHLVVDRTAATRLLASYPGRALDTRSAGGAVAPGSVTVVPTTPGIVIAANITAVNPAAAGYATVYPCAEGRAGTSTVNFAARTTTANFAAVKADSAGRICIYTTAATDLLFDAEAVSTSTIVAAAPVRSLDTRTLPVPLHPGTGKPFTASVARWYPTVVAALEARGLPATYSPGVMAQIMQESAGVPDAVNNNDSNWANGIASFGLLQTIYPTFNTYASTSCKGPNTPKLVNGIWQQYTPNMVNPSCNIGAGLTYVKARYGVAKLDSWNTGHNPAY